MSNVIRKEDLHILFMGTPDFSVKCLRKIFEEGYDIRAVVTQPDRPKGRKNLLHESPVKVYAKENGIPVLQYEKVSREGIDNIRDYGCNLFVTASFGQILSRKLLSLPEYGTINVHASLLPKYRGAAPIEWCIINGEKYTGITTMYTKFELDAGDMLLKKEVEIPGDITGGELRDILADCGAEVLSDTLKALTEGSLNPVSQNEDEASYFPMLDKGIGRIDFNKTYAEIHNLVRALLPEMPAYFEADGNRIQVYKVSFINGSADSLPGTVISQDPKLGLLIQAGDGIIEINELKYPGKKQMDDKSFLRGRQFQTEFID